MFRLFDLVPRQGPCSADRIRHVCAAGAEGHFRAGRRIARCLVFDFRVEFGTMTSVTDIHSQVISPIMAPSEP